MDFSTKHYDTKWSQFQVVRIHIRQAEHPRKSTKQLEHMKMSQYWKNNIILNFYNKSEDSQPQGSTTM